MVKIHFPCSDRVVLHVISSLDICKLVHFIPDEPVVLEAGYLLTLVNGEFFIGKKKVEGHWVDIRSRHH